MPKPGHITPSRIKDMMTSGRSKTKKWGDTAMSYAWELALERIGVDVPDNSGSYATDWGNEHEFQAIQAYEMNQLVEVHSSQVWQQHHKYKWVGGHPDGLIGDVGGMDTKCPYNITNHAKNIMENKQLALYKYQFQGLMWITGRKWWDFVSFDPRYPKELQIYVHRVDRDDTLIKKIDCRYQDFEMIIQGFVDSLIEKMQKNQVLA